MGPETALIDSAAETARALAKVLEREGIAAAPGQASTHRFVVSDDAPRFLSVGAKFIGDRLRGADP